MLSYMAFLHGFLTWLSYMAFLHGSIQLKISLFHFSSLMNLKGLY